MAVREEKIREAIRTEAAKFLHSESSGASLITVTNTLLSRDGKSATIFFTVFPDDKEGQALEFTKRKRTDFQQYLRENTSIGRIPLVDFQIDKGEKNRQAMDRLS